MCSLHSLSPEVLTTLQKEPEDAANRTHAPAVFLLPVMSPELPGQKFRFLFQAMLLPEPITND